MTRHHPVQPEEDGAHENESDDRPLPPPAVPAHVAQSEAHRGHADRDEVDGEVPLGCSCRGAEQTEERPCADREHLSGADVADVVSEVLILEATLQLSVGETESQTTQPDAQGEGRLGDPSGPHHALPAVSDPHGAPFPWGGGSPCLQSGTEALVPAGTGRMALADPSGTLGGSPGT